MTWVEFLNNLNDPDSLHRLVCGIKGEAPPGPTQKHGINICPFRGLEIFREQDTRFFFGRDYIIQQLLDYIEHHRLLVVIGPSGSGKSSIIQAGLISALKNSYINKVDSDKAALPVRIASFTPKERPFEELAFAIQRLDDLIMLPAEDIIKRLEAHDKSLYYIVREISERTYAQRILLVIDQFEELFTQTVNDNECKQFLSLITSAIEITNGPLMIIIAMRSDFLGKCSIYHDFNC